MFINENGTANLDIYGQHFTEEQCFELEKIALVISEFFDGAIYEHEVDDLAILLYQNKIRPNQINKNAGENTACYKYFGKRYKYLNEEEKREWARVRNAKSKGRPLRDVKKTLAYEIFGKAYKDLTYEEKKQYNAIRKREERKGEKQ